MKIKWEKGATRWDEYALKLGTLWRLYLYIIVSKTAHNQNQSIYMYKKSRQAALMNIYAHSFIGYGD